MSDPHLWATLVALFTHTFGLAFIAFGGLNTVLPSIHAQAVTGEHWMTDREFANLYALAAISPGPNLLIITLVGFKAAGVLGGIVGTVALCVPTSILAFGAIRVWDRFRAARWRAVVQAGLVPIVVGFVAASGLLLIHAADTKPPAYAVTAVTAIVGSATKFSPLWIFGAAALLGLAGFFS